MLLVTGFGLSLEHPTATEQMMRTAANSSALAILLQVRVSPVLLNRLMRFMVVASCRLAASCMNAGGWPRWRVLIPRGLCDRGKDRGVDGKTRCGGGATANRVLSRALAD